MSSFCSPVFDQHQLQIDVPLSEILSLIEISSMEVNIITYLTYTDEKMLAAGIRRSFTDIAYGAKSDTAE
jgi:hypothetical protein